MNEMIRVLLADDHPVIRDGYTRLLENTPDIRVVGEADNGEDVYKLYQELLPDIVVLDINMPGQGGMETIRRLRLRDEKAKVLVFSMHDSQVMVTRAIEAGAMGYLTKRSAPSQMVEAVRSVCSGRPYFDTALLPELVAMRQGNADPVKILSPREFQVFRSLSEGMTVHEIAENLCISPKTVGVHQTHIMSKLGMKNSAQLARLAIRCGVIEP